MTDNANQPNIPNSSPNIKEMANIGKEIYATIKDQLEPANNGKYVVIEVNSRRHFIGDTKDEAIANTRRVFPDTLYLTNSSLQLLGRN